MELKVLISILQSGTALPQLLNQVNQLSAALTKLQQQAKAGGGGAPVIPPIAPVLNQIPPAAKAATDAVALLDASIARITRTVRFLTGGFLALQGIGFIKSLADTAARAEVLQTTLHVVALNAGVMSTEIDKVDKAVQKMGITASSSRQSLIQMMQAKLDVSWAPKLARAAQDLAVVSGMNSSATFQRLLLNIQQMDALGLRWMGVMVSREQAERRWAEANNTTVQSMNRRQQVEAFMIETHRQILTLEGAYVASMGDVGKQLLSLERLTTQLKEVVGDQLLPAYSALVSELGHLYEQLIVIARVKTANKDGALALGDAVREWAVAVREWIVWGAQHIEIIINMVKWVVELKLAIWAIRTAVWIGSGAIAFIEFITKLNLALRALIAGQIGLTAVMTILRAQTVAAARETLALATAQQAATGTTGLFSIAIRGLVASLGALQAIWLGLAALLAVPLIGYIIYREQTDKGKSLAQRYKEIQEAKAGGGIGGVLEKVMDTEENVFREWQDKHKELIAKIEKEQGVRPKFFEKYYRATGQGPVQEAFRKDMEVLDPEQTQILYNKITQANVEIERLMEEQQKHIAAGNDAMATTAGLTVNRLRTERDLLTTELKKKTNLDAVAIGEEQVYQAQKKKWNLENEVNRTGTNSARERLKLASKELEIADEQLDTALRMRTPGLSQDEFNRQWKAARENIKKKRDEAFQDDVREAEKRQFGGALTFPGKVGEEISETKFTQGQKSFDLFSEQYVASAEAFGMATEETSMALRESFYRSGIVLREGLKSMAGAVRESDLPSFEKDVRKYIELTGDVKTASTALGLARISARQQKLGERAPIVAEARELTKIRTDQQVEEAKRALDTLKATGAREGATLEAMYRANLVGLNEYHDRRQERIRAEGEAELKLQAAQIAQQKALQAVEEDPRERAKIQNQIDATRNRMQVTRAQTDQALRDEETKRRERLRSLGEEARGGILGVEAGLGGQAEAQKQLNFQLDQEARKYAELEDTEERRTAERLIALKRITGEADIAQKFRERAYQLELGIEDAFQRQLDLRKQDRDLEAVRDRRQVEQGTMTGYEMMLRSNARIEQEMHDNRARRASEEERLRDQQKFAIIEEDKLRAKLSETIKDQGEIELQVRIARQKWIEDGRKIEETIKGIDVAYEELAISAETYGEKLKESFTAGFSDALTKSITDFRNAGRVWIDMATSITNEIVSIFAKAFTENLFKKLGVFSFVDRIMARIFGGGGKGLSSVGDVVPGLPHAVEGGLVSGPGTGTSDSILARVSTGEHIMPAEQTAQWLSVLEGIRTRKILPFVNGGVVQSIAMSPVIPRRYASGGVVVSDGGASAVQTGGGVGNMIVQMHPDTLNMTMRDWLEHEVVRQQGRR